MALTPLDRQLASKRHVASLQKMIPQIAAVCHTVNKAYCEAMGDDSQPDWKDAPDWQKNSAIEGVKLHLEDDIGPGASHEAWMKLKLEEGWKYGKKKDPEKKEHPCLVPFDKLPAEQQLKDYLFAAVVQGFKIPLEA